MKSERSEDTWDFIHSLFLCGELHIFYITLVCQTGSLEKQLRATDGREK